MANIDVLVTNNKIHRIVWFSFDSIVLYIIIYNIHNTSPNEQAVVNAKNVCARKLIKIKNMFFFDVAYMYMHFRDRTVKKKFNTNPRVSVIGNINETTTPRYSVILCMYVDPAKPTRH